MAGLSRLPTCFISYSWDSEDHQAWVRVLADTLTRFGVDVALDQYAVGLGASLTEFMERGVRERDYVLVICTPNFVSRANARHGGAGYEAQIVSAQLVERSSEDKFVPVLRAKGGEDHVPTYLAGRRYIDFSDDNLFDENVAELLRHLYNRPRFTRPAIGAAPDFDDADLVTAVATEVKENVRGRSQRSVTNRQEAEGGSKKVARRSTDRAQAFAADGRMSNTTTNVVSEAPAAKRTQFKRTKPHVMIGTIGHRGHGKTALTEAISKVMHERYPEVNQKYTLQEILRSPEEKQQRHTILLSHIEFESEERHYAFVDCPGTADYIKNTITGTSQMDGAILVVSATEGPMEQTREHIVLAKQFGVAQIVVALSKADAVDDDEVLELVELEVRELLTQYGFSGDDAPVITISSLGALQGKPQWVEALLRLIDAVDKTIPARRARIDEPFLMAIEEAFGISGRGTVVTGRIERGSVRLGDWIEVLGMQPGKQIAQVIGIEMFRKFLEEGHAGENVGLLLSGVDREEIQRGQVVAKPGTASAHTMFDADVFILPRADGGRKAPFFDNYRPQFYFRTTDITGTVSLPSGVEMVNPGTRIQLGVKLVAPIAMEEGLQFALREGGRTIGAGRITKVYDAWSRSVATAPLTDIEFISFRVRCAIARALPIDDSNVRVNSTRGLIELTLRNHQVLDQEFSELEQALSEEFGEVSLMIDPYYGSLDNGFHRLRLRV